MLIVTPAQASTLSQSQTVTVTGGHFYTYTYWQEVQTGTQQVQTGTTTETVVSGTGTCTDDVSYLSSSDNCPVGVPLTPIGECTETNYAFSLACTGSLANGPYYYGSEGGTTITQYDYPIYSTETVPTYTTEPVYTNEQFTGTAWSPATITYS